MLLFFVVAAIGIGYGVPPAAAQSLSNTVFGPFLSPPITPLVQEIDLRTLPKVTPWQEGDPVEEIDDDNETNQPPIGIVLPAEITTSQGQGSLASPAPPPGLGVLASFDGNPADGVLPPDTSGDVGPNHYIQAVNSTFSIYDKQGNLLAGPSLINSLWTGFGGPCQNQNSGDPIVQYDHLADRWIISQFTLPAANHQCFAVSRTGDPVAGGWYLYDFVTPGGNDYPKISVWPDAYYMSSQRGFFGSGLDVYAFDRANMLAGNPAGMVTFFVPASPYTIVLLPSDLDGPPPPAGTPNFFARPMDGDVMGGSDRIELFAFSVNWATPASSTFTPLPSLPTAPFNSVLCAPGSLRSLCVPQPGTAQKLDAPGVWPMWRLQYRNFGTHEGLVFNHTVNADGAGRAGIRWYELRRPPAGAWSIFQQGTHAPTDAVHRWMGSVAMDAEGNMALGYSASSSTLFPSIRYTGRLASDPLGAMTLPEVTIIAGGGSQTHVKGRWGDYATMSVDPVVGCQFWFTTEYIPFTTVAGWRTRIASFSLDTQPPTIHCPANIVQPADAGKCSAVVNFVVTATDDCPGTVATACLPASGSVFPIGPTTVNCTAADPAGNVANCSFTVTVVDTQPPVINCPANIVQPTDPGLCSAVVNFVAPATDNCPGVVVACLPPSGSIFPKGPTTVNCTATDASLNSASCSFTVTVVDTEPPVITCPPNETVEFTSLAGAIVNYPDPVVTDNCPGVTFVCAPPAGSVFPIGTKTVNCTATDTSANSSACSFTVTVLGALGVKKDVLADLIALRATVTDKEDGHKLDEAIHKLQLSIVPGFWIDQTHVQTKYGERVFQLEKETVQKLRELMNDKDSTIPAATLQGFIARIVKSDRLLAKVAIADAIAASGNSKKINEANRAVLEGDMDVLHRHYDGGIEDYRNAWHKALEAVK